MRCDLGEKVWVKRKGKVFPYGMLASPPVPLPAELDYPPRCLCRGLLRGAAQKLTAHLFLFLSVLLCTAKRQ